MWINEWLQKGYTEEKLRECRWLWSRKRAVVNYKKKTDRNGLVIEFKLSFAEFLELMYEHVDNYGRELDNVCLSRKDDIGHYEYGNVEVKTMRENNMENYMRQSVQAKNRRHPSV